MKLRYGAGAVLVAVSVLALPVWIDGQSQAPTVSGVSGSMAHNSQLTISGSSFGAKATAAPIKHDDFQNLAIGQNLSANGWRTSGYRPPVAYNGFLRSGTPFTRNAHSYFENGISFSQGGDVSNFYLTGLTTTRYYIDAWHYITTDGTPEPQNIKPWRLHSEGAGVPNAYFGFAGPSADDTVFGRDGTSVTDRGYFGSSDNGVGIPLRGSDWYNHWLHLQVLVDVGTPGDTNGTLVSYVNGALRVNYRNNIRVIAPGYANFPELFLGNYIRSDPHGTTHAYWESVYIDGSWARVEVGNNASYAACTKRETQIPTSWSSNSISVRVNRGSFPSLDGLYLFVVDSNGTPSPGYRLGSGSGTDVQPPASPTNVRVVR